MLDYADSYCLFKLFLVVCCHILPFNVSASIAKEAGERFGLIFIGCCGILGSVAILPVIINKLRESRITFKRQLSEQTVTTISSS
ncbi:hypothetical protein EB796_003123 [Bugula neritina]|uniref:Uncharacterized protein n=1 Tax=Bugula neritina TaxID=10212 RepID=A0A7J7KKL8_BUGNE|nr:hypothetical protein EB796_003123 [Bugula neritina]